MPYLPAWFAGKRTRVRKVANITQLSYLVMFTPRAESFAKRRLPSGSRDVTIVTVALLRALGGGAVANTVGTTGAASLGQNPAHPHNVSQLSRPFQRMDA